MSIEYAILVRNKTRLEILIERFNTKAQTQFYIERSGGDFKDYEDEHIHFYDSFSVIQRQLSSVIRNKVVERSFLPSFLFAEKHMVVVVGQDGLVANTAKYVGGIPIIAVNPDLARYDGVLLPFNTDNFMAPVHNVLENRFRYESVSFAEARLNDGQKLYAFNDLFIGAASHVSARYKITFGKRTEEHSSSGVIVSTKAGSTGWLSSIFNMNYGLGQLTHQATSLVYPNLAADQLFFAVREPFASKKTQAGIVGGVLTPQSTLVIESRMPVNGVIFSDGIESDFIKFNSGSIATIGIAPQKAVLVKG